MQTGLVREVGGEGGGAQFREEKCSEAGQNNPGTYSGPQTEGKRGECLF